MTRVAEANTTDTKVEKAERAHLTLKDMVRGARTTARAVRFYEEQGLISTIGRSPGGHRLFGAGELDKLQLVLELRTCGFSIEEIRDILESKGKCGTVREAALSIQSMLARRIDELHNKIATIERLGREFSVSIKMLDRCVHCTDPRGAEGCSSCDLPRTPGTPHSFRHIWGVAAASSPLTPLKPKPDPGC
jgi:DNA-binding transcriptional MerR regulator